MGASRDFTTGTVTGSRGNTAVLDRAEPRSYRRKAPVVPRSTGYRTAPLPTDTPLPRREHPRRSRLGSQQVVSVRGRRTRELKNVTLLAKLGIGSFILLLVGVAVAIWLTGVSTQQTFRMSQLVAQEQQLNNQVETLNRDLENIRSSAEIARRANEMGMAIPSQPGILYVSESGDIVEQRPAQPETQPIINVNGAPVRPGQASSDPEATDEVADQLAAVPEGRQLPSADNGLSANNGQGALTPPAANLGVAPYAPNVPAAE